MIKINKTFSGLVTCYDEQMLSYSIRYTCIIKRSIFTRNMKMKSLHFNSIIEGTIREIVAENKMKYFVKDIKDEFNKERDKWVDIVKTNKAQYHLKELIKENICNNAIKFNFDIVDFSWIPIQQCHSLYTALS